MDFDKICTIFTMQEPYYGILLSAMDRFPTNMIDTIGVCRSGNVFRLGYNPKFIADKDLNTMLVLLKHEMLHVAFNHLSDNFWSELHLKGPMRDIRNIAEDLEINCYLDFSNTKGIYPYLPSKFDWEPRLGAKEYFKRLKQYIEDKQKEQQKKNSEENNPATDSSQKPKKKVKFNKQQSKAYKLRKAGKSWSEISVEMGCTEEEVKNLVSFVRNTMKDKMLVK